MVRLDAGIDDDRGFAFPVLVLDMGAIAENVLGRVGTRKRQPQKIAKGSGVEVVA